MFSAQDCFYSFFHNTSREDLWWTVAAVLGRNIPNTKNNLEYICIYMYIYVNSVFFLWDLVLLHIIWQIRLIHDMYYPREAQCEHNHAEFLPVVRSHCMGATGQPHRLNCWVDWLELSYYLFSKGNTVQIRRNVWLFWNIWLPSFQKVTFLTSSIWLT